MPPAGEPGIASRLMLLLRVESSLDSIGIASTPDAGAHGVAWDRARQWAQGDDFFTAEARAILQWLLIEAPALRAMNRQLQAQLQAMRAGQ